MRAMLGCFFSLWRSAPADVQEQLRASGLDDPECLGTLEDASTLEVRGVLLEVGLARAHEQCLGDLIRAAVP